MPDKRHRLDLALVERGLAPTRARASGAIKSGCVRVGGKTVTKAAGLVGDGDIIEIDSLEHPYVSRAALKLVHALDSFALDPANRHCLDLGASTGGFTQAAGARRRLRRRRRCGARSACRGDPLR